MELEIKELYMDYKSPIKAPGIKGSLKMLFHTEYEIIHALSNLNFSSASGDVIGLVGNNGSGKTTLLKIIAGLLAPVKGEIKVGEYVPLERKDSFLKQLGFAMGQRGQLWWDLPPIDSYELLIDIYGCNRETTKRYIYELAERLKIEECLRKPIKMSSLGQRMKAELIGAILHKPTLLILDEPTIGLDATSAKMIREVIKEECSRREMIVIISSHILDDIQEICNRLLILDHGKVLYNNSLNNCYKEYMLTKTISVKFNGAVPNDIPYTDNIVDMVNSNDGGLSFVLWELDRHLVPEALAHITQLENIKDISISERTLGTIIEEITKGK